MSIFDTAAVLAYDDLCKLWLAVARRCDPIMAKLMDDGIIPLDYPKEELMVKVIDIYQGCEEGHFGRWRMWEGKAICRTCGK